MMAAPPARPPQVGKAELKTDCMIPPIVFIMTPTMMPAASPSAPLVIALPIAPLAAAVAASAAIEIIPAARSLHVKPTQRVLGT